MQTKKNCYPTLDIGNNESLKTKLEFQNNEVAAQTKDMGSPQDRLVHYINGCESARRIENYSTTKSDIKKPSNNGPTKFLSFGSLLHPIMHTKSTLATIPTFPQLGI